MVTFHQWMEAELTCQAPANAKHPDFIEALRCMAWELAERAGWLEQPSVEAVFITGSIAAGRGDPAASREYVDLHVRAAAVHVEEQMIKVGRRAIRGKPPLAGVAGRK